jgi:1-deoxy-D-xylulose-5-phosphate reductoisomerase
MTINVAVLGSTGSIGRQTLDVIRQHPDYFRVAGLAAGSNLDLLEQQVREFHPSIVSTTDPCPDDRFTSCESCSGDDGLMHVATNPHVDIVVVATTGHNAIKPTLAAIEAGKQIAIANKEVIVCAGEILLETARRCGVELRPVDSEHSAIWQCLKSGNTRNDVKTISLTASGGALRDLPLEEIGNVTVEQALAHPNWTMGPKVTIDSASLMNKGLEVIEAHWLFETPYDDIEVVIHPQSIVHSMVTFRDGSTVAQLGLPDMRVPIQYALSYPMRLPSPDRCLSLSELGRLDFSPPDPERYPALELAFSAGRAGSTYPTVLSAVDEVAVDAFLNREIRFGTIVSLVARSLDAHSPESGPLTIEAIERADVWSRSYARSLICAGTG